MDGTSVYCSCLDFTNRSLKNPLHICKHMRAIVLAGNYGLITIEKNNENQNRGMTTNMTFKKSYEFVIIGNH